MGETFLVGNLRISLENQTRQTIRKWIIEQRNILSESREKMSQLMQDPKAKLTKDFYKPDSNIGNRLKSISDLALLSNQIPINDEGTITDNIEFNTNYLQTIRQQDRSADRVLWQFKFHKKKRMSKIFIVILVLTVFIIGLVLLIKYLKT